MSPASCLVICQSPRLLRRRAATRLTLPLCLIWAWLLHGKNILPLVERSLVIWSPPAGEATLKIRLLLLGSDDGYNWLLGQPRCFGSSIEKTTGFNTGMLPCPNVAWIMYLLCVLSTSRIVRLAMLCLF